MERNMNALPYEAKVALVNLVTKEVFCALMIMKSYKAPGLDGYQPIFFKMFQDEVGDEVCHFGAKAFATGTFDATVIETLLALIPKGDVSKTFIL